MDENVKFNQRFNPPNVSQARPIENFWGSLAQKFSKKSYSPGIHPGKSGLHKAESTNTLFV